MIYCIITTFFGIQCDAQRFIVFVIIGYLFPVRNLQPLKQNQLFYFLYMVKTVVHVHYIAC